MRAAVVKSLGQPPVAGELPEPTRGEGQALIEVKAAALNPFDLVVASGALYSPPPLPFAPGAEGVGVVVEGDRLSPGARVRFQGMAGALAERVAADEAGVIELNGDLPDEVVAGLGVAGMAALLALEWRAQLRRGETVLVLGATGVVGALAVQIAKILGAARVVAAGRDRDALSATREHGADATVQLDGQAPEQLGAEFQAAADGPVDVIVDAVWGVPAAAATYAAAPGARLVNIGQSAGPVAALPSAMVRSKLLTILGHTNLLAPPELRTAAFERLLDHVARGELSLPYETIPLAKVAEAWERQSHSPHRKLIVRVAES
jgi:NADPH:quinone reductase-like Zn-dependent oxidoreductase